MQPPEDHFPAIEQSVSLDRARVSVPISMLWGIAVALVMATLWAANQWWVVSSRLNSMSAAIERIERNTRNNWTKQSMQVWSLETRRLNKDFVSPSVNEVWDATHEPEK